MPIYSIQGPDNKTYDIEGPAGATDDQIIKALQQHLATAKPAASKAVSAGDVGADLGYSALSGIGSLVQFPGQVYGLATGDMDNATTQMGGAISKYAQAHQSAGLKARQQAQKEAIAKASEKGFLSEAGTAVTSTLKDPVLFGNFIAENIPNMIPGFGLSRGTMAMGMRAAAKQIAEEGLEGEAKRLAMDAAQKSLAKKAEALAVGTAVTQQGADVGAQAYTDIYAKLKSQGASDEAAAAKALSLARAAGATGSVISYLSSRLPGARALEQSFAGAQGAKAVTAGALKGVVGEGISEGVEEGGGALARNAAMATVDPTQNIMQGVGQAVGQGALLGGALGAGAGMLHSGRAADIASEEAAQRTAAGTAQQEAATAAQQARRQDPQYLGKLLTEYDQYRAKINDLKAAASAGDKADPLAQAQRGQAKRELDALMKSPAFERHRAEVSAVQPELDALRIKQAEGVAQTAAEKQRVTQATESGDVVPPMPQAQVQAMHATTLQAKTEAAQRAQAAFMSGDSAAAAAAEAEVKKHNGTLDWLKQKLEKPAVAPRIPSAEEDAKKLASLQRGYSAAVMANPDAAATIRAQVEAIQARTQQRTAQAALGKQMQDATNMRADVLSEQENVPNEPPLTVDMAAEMKRVFGDTEGAALGTPTATGPKVRVAKPVEAPGKDTTAQKEMGLFGDLEPGGSAGTPIEALRAQVEQLLLRPNMPAATQTQLRNYQRVLENPALSDTANARAQNALADITDNIKQIAYQGAGQGKARNASVGEVAAKVTDITDRLVANEKNIAQATADARVPLRGEGDTRTDADVRADRAREVQALEAEREGLLDERRRLQESVQINPTPYERQQKQYVALGAKTPTDATSEQIARAQRGDKRGQEVGAVNVDPATQPYFDFQQQPGEDGEVTTVVRQGERVADKAQTTDRGLARVTRTNERVVALNRAGPSDTALDESLAQMSPADERTITLWNKVFGEGSAVKRMVSAAREGLARVSAELGIAEKELKRANNILEYRKNELDQLLKPTKQQQAQATYLRGVVEEQEKALAGAEANVDKASVALARDKAAVVAARALRVQNQQSIVRIEEAIRTAKLRAKDALAKFKLSYAYTQEQELSPELMQYLDAGDTHTQLAKARVDLMDVLQRRTRAVRSSVLAMPFENAETESDIAAIVDNARTVAGPRVAALVETVARATVAERVVGHAGRMLEEYNVLKNTVLSLEQSRVQRVQGVKDAKAAIIARGETVTQTAIQREFEVARMEAAKKELQATQDAIRDLMNPEATAEAAEAVADTGAAADTARIAEIRDVLKKNALTPTLAPGLYAELSALLAKEKAAPVSARGQARAVVAEAEKAVGTAAEKVETLRKNVDARVSAARMDVKRAEETRDELYENERALLAKQKMPLQAKIDAAATFLQTTINDATTALAKTLEPLTADLTDVSGDITTAEKHIQKLAEVEAALVKLLHDQTTDFQDTQERVNTLADTADLLHPDIDAGGDRFDAVQNRAETKAAVQALATDEAEIRTERDAATKPVRALLDENEKMLADAGVTPSHRALLTAHRKRLDTQLRQLEKTYAAKIANVRERIHAVNEELATAPAPDTSRMQQDIAVLKGMRNELRSKVAEINAAIDSLAAQRKEEMEGLQKGSEARLDQLRALGLSDKHYTGLRRALMLSIETNRVAEEAADRAVAEAWGAKEVTLDGTDRGAYDQALRFYEAAVNRRADAFDNAAAAFKTQLALMESLSKEPAAQPAVLRPLAPAAPVVLTQTEEAVAARLKQREEAARALDAAEERVQQLTADKASAEDIAAAEADAADKRRALVDTTVPVQPAAAARGVKGRGRSFGDEGAAMAAFRARTANATPKALKQERGSIEAEIAEMHDELLLLTSPAMDEKGNLKPTGSFAKHEQRMLAQAEANLTNAYKSRPVGSTETKAQGAARIEEAVRQRDLAQTRYDNALQQELGAGATTLRLPTPKQKSTEQWQRTNEMLSARMRDARNAQMALIRDKTSSAEARNKAAAEVERVMREAQAFNRIGNSTNNRAAYLEAEIIRKEEMRSAIDDMLTSGNAATTGEKGITPAKAAAEVERLAASQPKPGRRGPVMKNAVGVADILTGDTTPVEGRRTSTGETTAATTVTGESRVGTRSKPTDKLIPKVVTGTQAVSQAAKDTAEGTELRRSMEQANLERTAATARKAVDKAELLVMQLQDSKAPEAAIDQAEAAALAARREASAADAALAKVAKYEGAPVVFRTATAEGPSMAVRDITNLANRLMAEWTNTPPVRVVQSVSDLPQRIRDQIAADQFASTPGLFDPEDGSVYIVADNIRSPEDAVLTIAHEVSGHYGLRDLLGSGYAKLMNELYTSVPGVKADADARMAKIPSLTREIAVEEILADRAETQPGKVGMDAKLSKLYYTLKAALRTFLGRIGIKPNMLRITDKEIGQIVANARAHVKRGVTGGPRGGHRVASAQAGRTSAYRPAPVNYGDFAGTPIAGNAVAEAPRSIKERFTDDLAMRAEYNLADQHVYVVEAMRRAGGHAATQVEMDIRAAGAPAMQAASFIQQGAPEVYTDAKGYSAIRASTKDSGAEFFEAVRALPGTDAQAKFNMYTEYMKALRGLRLGPEKVGENVTREQLQAVVDQVQNTPALRAAMENARAKYNAFNTKMVAMAVETGVVSEEFGKTMTEHGDYVPMYREKDGQLEVFMDNRYESVGDIAHTPFMHAFKGGKAQVLPINQTIFMNTELLTKMSLINTAKKNFGYVMSEVGKPHGKMEILPGAGPAGADVLTWKENGEAMHLRMDTEGTVLSGIPTAILAQSIDGYHATLPQSLMWMQKANDMLRAGITRMPMYMFRQLLKDPASAAIIGGMRGGPVMAVARAFKEYGKVMTGQTADMDRLARMGLIQSSLFTGNPDDMQVLARQMAGGDAPTAIRTFLNFLDKSSSAANATTQLQMYNDSIKKGLSEVEAMHRTRESMNFHKRGASATVQQANRTLVFFNSGVQALNVLQNTLRGRMPFEERLQTKQKFVRNAMLMMVGGFLYSAAMADDDKYRKLRMRDKVGNMHFALGDGEFVKLPISYFETGGGAWAAGQALAAMMEDNTEGSAVLKALGQYALTAVPGGGGLPIGPGVKQVGEWATNKDFTTFRDIVPTSKAGLAPSEQFTSATPEALRDIGAALGVSPIKLDHMLQSLFGSAVDASLQLLDQVAPDTENARPTRGMSETPFVGTLFQNKATSQAMDDMYTAANDVTEVTKTLAHMRTEGHPEAGITAYRDAHQDELRQAKVVQQFTQEMATLSGEIRQIEESRMGPDEKQKRIDIRKQRKLESAERLNKARRRILKESSET